MDDKSGAEKLQGFWVIEIGELAGMKKADIEKVKAFLSTSDDKWFGLTWSLELYQQTNARLHRQGQKDTVIIHHIITAGTIDEDVMKALRKKERTQNALIDAVKAKLGASL